MMAAVRASPAVGGSAIAGMALMVAAMTIIPVMDGIAKGLTTRYPTAEVVWARYFFHFALLVPLVVWRYGRRTFAMERPWLQVFRGSLLMLATLCFFGAIAEMPLADAVAIVFVYPFIVTALAPVLLGEKVGVWRWSAVVVGFCGAMIIIRPGFQAFSPAMVLALATGCIYALYVVITRKLAGRDPPLVTLLMTGLVGTVCMSLVMPFVWVMPTPGDFALMVLIGLLAASGHLMIIVAHEWARASQLAPFGYVEIVSGTVVGYLMFGDLPAALTWLGIAIIVASGIVIAWREALVTRRQKLAAALQPG